MAGFRKPKGSITEGVLLLERVIQAILAFLFDKMTITDETHFGDLCSPIMGCEDISQVKHILGTNFTLP